MITVYCGVGTARALGPAGSHYQPLRIHKAIRHTRTFTHANQLEHIHISFRIRVISVKYHNIKINI